MPFPIVPAPMTTVLFTGGQLITLPEVGMQRTISAPGFGMASNCILCGKLISQGILCENCDRPRRPKSGSGEGALHGTTTATLPTAQSFSFPLDPVSPAIAT